MSDSEQQPEPSPKRFERKPNREVFLSASKDGRFLIVKVVESWILPRNYPQKVLGLTNPNAASADAEKPLGKSKKKRS